METHFQEISVLKTKQAEVCHDDDFVVDNQGMTNRRKLLKVSGTCQPTKHAIEGK